MTVIVLFVLCVVGLIIISLKCLMGFMSYMLTSLFVDICNIFYLCPRINVDVMMKGKREFGWGNGYEMYLKGLDIDPIIGI